MLEGSKRNKKAIQSNGGIKLVFVTVSLAIFSSLSVQPAYCLPVQPPYCLPVQPAYCLSLPQKWVSKSLRNPPFNTVVTWTIITCISCTPLCHRATWPNSRSVPWNKKRTKEPFYSVTGILSMTIHEHCTWREVWGRGCGGVGGMLFKHI